MLAIMVVIISHSGINAFSDYKAQACSLFELHLHIVNEAK